MSLMAHAPSFFRRNWPAVLLCAAAAAGSSGAWAQATRTWLSGVGDDANPCSRTAPCKTFAGSIAKTAANGEINVLDPAGVGTLTITKSILVDGTGVLAGVLASGTVGIVINANPSDTVVLRDLDIVGAGTGTVGVRIVGAGKVVLDKVRIQGFTQNAVSVESGAATKVFVQNSQILLNTGTAALNVADAASVLYLSNSTVFGNGMAFNAVTGGKIVSFNNNRLEGNTDPSAPTDTVYER
jgi:hypothetical protein